LPRNREGTWMEGMNGMCPPIPFIPCIHVPTPSH
jgi:hypothetical protein